MSNMLKIRIKAILYCVKFGVLPYWLYEPVKHYSCSYLAHLLINLKYAYVWLTFKENDGDVEFEKIKNNNY